MKRLLFTFVCLLLPASAQALDAFDRLSMAQMRGFAQSNEPAAEMTLGEATALRGIGRGVTTPCVFLKTDQGNWTKALVTWGLRKTADGPVSVLLVERFVTYDATRPGVTTATGENVMLFAGFAYDFDIGQVVPSGIGQDIVFTDERSVQAAEASQMFPVSGPPAEEVATSTKPDPNDHEGVLPRDFSGVWKLDADGRWQGFLELQVDDDGNVAGKYLSDETQSSYNIVGRVDSGDNRMILEVELPNTPQSYEAYLWTTDKSAMAGVTTLSERRFGFHAVRVVEEEGE